jgi:hypothetical protein
LGIEHSALQLELHPQSRYTGVLKHSSESNLLHVHFLQIYPIKERNDRTRQALIICNIEFDHLTLREGADFDITGMKGLLEDLGYTVVVEKNLTASVRTPTSTLIS